MSIEIVGDRIPWRYALRLERANLKQYHTSPSAGAICSAADTFIIEERPYSNGGSLVMKEGWREAMKMRARKAVSK